MWQSPQKCGVCADGTIYATKPSHNFSQVLVLKSLQGTTFYTYAPDVHDAWLTLSALSTQFPTRVHHGRFTLWRSVRYRSAELSRRAESALYSQSPRAGYRRMVYPAHHGG